MKLISKIVLSMAILRIVSGVIEVTAAILMLRMNSIERALLINSGLALVGPLILIATTAIGLAGLADKLSPIRFLWVLLGVTCLFIGILKK
jgi:putative exporter of polyketide antibiotics